MPTESTPSNSDPALAAYDSPIGSLMLAARGGALVGLWVTGQRFFGSPYGINEAVAAPLEILPSRAGSGGESRGVTGEDAAALTAATSWLEQYFAGENPSPARLHMTPEGTLFQKRVWEAMARIPYGHTRTYSQIAAQLREAGVAASPRAVGGAVGRNPLLIVRPCHRVVAASHMGGYAAGAEAKAWLFEHEAATASSIG
ncbi:methylated-DNA--[protein]-cysteine S-methyltransferase [Actinomyces sp.]